ncbi:MAG: nucleoside/nucleotide kinase family protein [Actinobacteria bacterium]|nr:nucleoside/nucleotide kinase family protein [Actinomycetota bacterium]
MAPVDDGSRQAPRAVTLDAAVDRARTLLAPGRRTLLGIVGPPGAGKSTVSAALVAALPAGSAVVVPMDGYHLAQAELERLGRAMRKGAPDTFDAAGFVALLARIAAQPRTAPDAPRADPTDGVVWAPLFRREIEEPIANAVPVDPATPLVVVEGNYLLLAEGAWAGVRPLLDEGWYADLDDAVRVERLVARHVAHGRTPEAATEWVHRSDEANARLVARTAVRADLLVRIP